MARIPESEIEQLKSSVDIVGLIQSKGIELKKHGKDLVGKCPFHNDKTPSLVVTPNKGLWHCMGACQMGGSVIDWVMKSEGLSFRHAVSVLQEGGVSSISNSKIIKSSTIPKLSNPFLAADLDSSLDAGLVAHSQVLKRTVDYYHETLKNTPDALKYLSKRGLNHSELISTFKIGFSDRSLGLRLPYKNRVEGQKIRKELQEVGLFRKSGHEHFRGCITFPIFKNKDVIGEVYGRKINDGIRQGTAYHLYLPGEHVGVFNREALAQKEVILCESVIDALSFWVHGFRNVTCSFGIEGFSEELLSVFINQGVKRVYIAYDSDKAGDLAADKLGVKLNSEGIETLRVQFPLGEDANSFICSNPQPAEGLQRLINQAVWLGNKEQKQPTTQPLKGKEAESLSSLDAGLVADSVKEKELLSEIPSTPKVDVPCKIEGENVYIPLGDRLYRVRGLFKNLSYEVLRVNIKVSLGSAFYVDTLDLYHAKLRENYVSKSALEIEVKAEIIKRDLGRVLLKLEELQEVKIRETLEPETKEVLISEDDQIEAMKLLKSENLIDDILTDFETCGVVGEEVNKLVCYLSCVSRKLDSPLAVVIQSTSSAGKTSLMDAVLGLIPDEDKVRYSSMSGQSLFYMGEVGLKHKVLAIAEEEGVRSASYSLKLLQSDGKLTMASTGKDPQTGRLTTMDYEVEGPVMLFMTTTSVDLDEELMNRCITLTVDESREQTRAIHKLQRHSRTLDGLKKKNSHESLKRVHHNAQRLLESLKIVNPFAVNLTFTDSQTRTRRDQMKYLNLIDSIAFLHQHSRPIKSYEGIKYIEVTLDDIDLANVLAAQVLGRSLDELPPQTRNLLFALHEMVKGECETKEIEFAQYRFTRRELREFTSWSDTQLRVHLGRLVELEYLITHRGGRGQSFVYELLYQGEGEGEIPFLMGLLDVQELKKKHPNYVYDKKYAGLKARFTGSKCPQNGTKSEGVRSSNNPLSLATTTEYEIKAENGLKVDIRTGELLEHPIVATEISSAV